MVETMHRVERRRPDGRKNGSGAKPGTFTVCRWGADVAGATEHGAEDATAQGGKASAELATLPADGPTGKFIHMGQTVPW